MRLVSAMRTLLKPFTLLTYVVRCGETQFAVAATNQNALGSDEMGSDQRLRVKKSTGHSKQGRVANTETSHREFV